MLFHLKNAGNITLTENGAVTPRTTGSDCLNLFATIGALRTQNEAEIHHMGKGILEPSGWFEVRWDFARHANSL